MDEEIATEREEFKTLSATDFARHERLLANVLERKSLYENSKDGSLLVMIPGGEYSVRELNSKVQVGTYYIAINPVSKAQYSRFVLEANRKMSFNDERLLRELEAHGSCTNEPATGLGLDDALAYCNWSGLRLPNEAEWQIGVRGPSRTPFGGPYKWHSKNTRVFPIWSGPTVSEGCFGAYWQNDGAAEWCRVSTIFESVGPHRVRRKRLDSESFEEYVSRGGIVDRNGHRFLREDYGSFGGLEYLISKYALRPALSWRKYE